MPRIKVNSKYSFHPACKLFPGLPEHELQELAQHGLQNPMIIHEGKTSLVEEIGSQRANWRAWSRAAQPTPNRPPGYSLTMKVSRGWEGT